MTGAISTTPFTQALAGLDAASAKADRAATAVAAGDGNNLAGDLVNLIEAKVSFKANAIVLRTADEMQQSLLHAVDFKA